MTAHTRAGEYVALKSARGRLVVLATVLGSGTVFLEATVVNVALPSIGRDLHLGMAGLQWILDGYLLTLSALILLGGALGDAYGRGRIFVVGLLAFGVACVAAALAPNLQVLVIVRLLQGAAGALLVPNSLALLETVFQPSDRGAAIGQWAAWSAASTALGPLLGGVLLQFASWRWIFAAVAPFALLAAVLGVRVFPATAHRRTARAVDYPGAALVTLGLAGITTAFIEGPVKGFRSVEVAALGVLGVALVAAFFVYEARTREPLLPLSMFRSWSFSGANAATLFAYAALNGLFFLLMLQLQNNLAMSPLIAGASLLPVNALMLVLSPVSGRVATKIGARLPMTVGAAVAGVGMLLFSRVQRPGDYMSTMLPALIVFGVGLATFVAPLTATVLEAAAEALKGVASAFNNAVARVAGLVATAILPVAAGIGGNAQTRGPALAHGYARAMLICAGLCFVASAVSYATVQRGAPRKSRS